MTAPSALPTVARQIVRCLENEGVRFVFGLPGEENLHTIDALVDSSIRFITTRDERGAAFMADTYGALTGRAGVCLATLGPGAINLMLGIANAQLDSHPLVAIAAQAGLDRIYKESHQFVDLVSVFRPITKWGDMVTVPDAAPEMVRKAFKQAETERPGATFLIVPEDVAERDCEGEPLPVNVPVDPAPAEAQVTRAVEILAHAKDPVVLAGPGVARDGATDALIRFSERLSLPVATTFLGKGVFPDDHPNALGTIGTAATARPVDERRPPAMALVREELERGAADGAFPLKPQRIVADIRAALGHDDIVLADTGAVKMWMARLYPTYRPNTCIVSNGLATMAFSLPGAFAAKLVHPDRRVLAAMGDGAFLMSAAEIETAVREGVHITILVWVDGGYGLIRWKEELTLGRTAAVSFGNPDLVRFAESFGAKGYAIGAADELLPTLRRALEDEAVSVIACPVDYAENRKLVETLG